MNAKLFEASEATNKTECVFFYLMHKCGSSSQRSISFALDGHLPVRKWKEKRKRTWFRNKALPM